jgi:hypothetical protein
MTIVSRVLAVAAFSLAASLSAQAEEGEKSGAQSAPIPTLHCEFKSVNACSPDGGCKEGKDLAGMPLPLKVSRFREHGSGLRGRHRLRPHRQLRFSR